MANKTEAKAFKGIKMGINDKGDIVLTIPTQVYRDMQLSKDDLSKGGESYVIASTRGNAQLTAEGLTDLKLGLNLYVSKETYDNKVELRNQKELARQELARKKDMEGQARMSQPVAAPATSGMLDKLLALDPEKLKKLEALLAVL